MMMLFVYIFGGAMNTGNGTNIAFERFSFHTGRHSSILGGHVVAPFRFNVLLRYFLGSPSSYL